MSRQAICIAAAAFILASSPLYAVTKTFDNQGADNLWSNAANWEPNGVPTSADDVILDNIHLSGSYVVSINDGITYNVRTLTVGAPVGVGSGTVRLGIAGSATIQLVIAGDTTSADDFVIEGLGIMNNASTAPSGNVIDNTATGNTSRVKSGGQVWWQTARSFGNPFAATGNGAATFESNSTIQFEQLSGTAVPLSGRTYGNLNLLASSAKTYTSTGSGAATIQGNLTIGANCTYNTTMTGSFTLRGNLVSNGNGGSISSTSAGFPLFDGTTTISGSGTALTFPNAFRINSAASVSTSSAVTIPASRIAEIDGTLNVSGSFTVTGTLNVNNGGSVVLGQSILTGTGTTTFGGGSSVSVTNAEGITSSGATGAIRTTDRSFGANVNYTFANAPGSTSPASTGDAMASPANAVTIANAATAPNDVTTLAKSMVIVDFNIADGIFETGNNLLNCYDTQVDAGAEFRVSPSGAYTPSTATTIVHGAGTFTFQDGGAMVIRHTEGITSSGATGSIQTANRTFAINSEYQYNYADPASLPQNTGNGLPSAVAILSFANYATGTNNRTLLTQDVTANLLLDLNSGAVETGAFTLTAQDSIFPHSTNGYVLGSFRRLVDTNTPGTRRFPVSSAFGSFNLFEINPGSSTGSGTITVSTTAGDHPSITAPAADALSRYWTVSSTGLTINNATLTFHYDDTALGTADESLFSAQAWNGSAWTEYARPTGTAIDTLTNTATVTGVSALSDWTLWETAPAGVSEWSEF